MRVAQDVWRTFAHDPRDPALAGLRASDHDREVVAGILASAYAEGRLDRDELDERQAAAAQARTLGDLPPIVSDLVAVRPGAAALVERAEDEWRDQRRSAAFGVLAAALVCWVVWFALGADGFVWPAVVNAVTLLHLGRVQVGRKEIVRAELRRLEKRQARELRKRGWRP